MLFAITSASLTGQQVMTLWGIIIFLVLAPVVVLAAMLMGWIGREKSRHAGPEGSEVLQVPDVFGIGSPSSNRPAAV